MEEKNLIERKTNKKMLKKNVYSWMRLEKDVREWPNHVLRYSDEQNIMIECIIKRKKTAEQFRNL